MGSDDVTLGVLIEIRDAIRATNDRVDGTNARVDTLTERVDGTNARVDKLTDGVEKLTNRVDRVEVGLGDLRKAGVASEVRTVTAMHELNDTMRSVHTLLKDRLELRDRVERCEHDIEEIKRKIG